MKISLTIPILLTALIFSFSAMAQCYRVTSYYNSETGTPGNSQIRSGQGDIAINWTSDGTCDTCNGKIGFPAIIVLDDDVVVTPEGTIIEERTVKFESYGRTSGYDPETVFYKCNPEDDVYELYSTNGDSTWGGRSQGLAPAAALGIPNAYITAFSDISIRITNITDGNKPFSHIWQQRLLTGLDERDGKKLVKAKNLSEIKVELIRVNNINKWARTAGGAAGKLYDHNKPNGYVTIGGPGITQPTAGNDHCCDYNGFKSWWVGAIGLYGDVTLRRIPRCGVTDFTPLVKFPSISTSEINNNNYIEGQISLELRCLKSDLDKSSANRPLLAFKVPTSSLANMTDLGLNVANTGVTHLIDNNYGSPGVATGVGVRFYRNNNPVNLYRGDGFENLPSTSNRANNGWHTFESGERVLVDEDTDTRTYRESIKVRFQKLDVGTQPAVAPGTFNATAEIIVRVP